jgi:hypothetical protein
VQSGFFFKKKPPRIHFSKARLLWFRSSILLSVYTNSENAIAGGDAMRVEHNEMRYGVDLDAGPVVVPEGFEVVEHLLCGHLEWNPLKPQIELYLPVGQRKGLMEGGKVFEQLLAFDGRPVNANMLDYLLANLAVKPWLIPESWKNVENSTEKHILFWGTRYRFEGGICVRSLNWNADARERVWRAGYCWVDNRLNAQFPAAMLRKPKEKIVP